MADGSYEQLQTELELIAASILPTETVVHEADGPLDNGITLPAAFSVKSADSPYSLSINVSTDYPAGGSVKVQVKSAAMGRDEADGWGEWVQRIINDEWDEADGGYVLYLRARSHQLALRSRTKAYAHQLTPRTPLYTLMTDHLLPILAPVPVPSDTQSASQDTSRTAITNQDRSPHHVLIITHHLLSATKRKNLLHLSSSLNLVGFSKTGHPGILYAIGMKDDLSEWLTEVKSWNWLALRVRIAIEQLDQAGEQQVETGSADGPGQGIKKQRGEWVELDKLGEAMEWLRKRGREGILIDAGVGSRGG